MGGNKTICEFVKTNEMKDHSRKSEQMMIFHEISEILRKLSEMKSVFSR